MKFRTTYLSIILFAMLLHCFTSCNGPLTVDEMHAYLHKEKNGTVKTSERAGLKVEVVYRPTALMVQQELAEGKENLLPLKKKYGKYFYFLLSLKQDGKDLLNSTAPNRQLFASINEQLSFRLNENICIVDNNKDTAYLVDFFFPRLYEVSRSTTVLLAFEKEEIRTEQFKIRLKDIANTSGIIELAFSKEDIRNIPSLKF